jgi:hypothetical protein
MNVKTLLVVMGWAMKDKKKSIKGQPAVYSGGFQAIDLSHPVSLLESFYLKTDKGGGLKVSVRTFKVRNPDLTLFTPGEPDDKGDIFYNYNHRYQLIDAVVETEVFTDRSTGLRTPIDILKQFKPKLISVEELFSIINSNNQFFSPSPVYGTSGERMADLVD